MTDGERARLRDAMAVFSEATARVRKGSEQQVSFGAIVMALGWVLDESMYATAFEEVVKTLKAMGVGKGASGSKLT